MRFGTDGIRGPVHPDGVGGLTPAVAWALGRSLAALLPGRTGVVRDTRWSGPGLRDALAAGLRAGGSEVVDFGVLPTAGLTAAAVQGLCEVGVAVTASHNPASDNGLKVIGPGGAKLDDPVEAALEQGLAACIGDAPASCPAAPEDPATVARGVACWRRGVLLGLPEGFRLDGLRVAVDAAHGAAWTVAPALLAWLGAEVVTLGCAPDGHNINHLVGAVHPEALQALVVQRGCQVGLALDGDADRCQLVDARGHLVDGDALLLLLARPPGVVGTSMSNAALERALEARGMALHRADVGDRAVSQAMRRLGWPVGGEPSGHVLLADGLPTGDGTATALRVLAGGADLGSRLADWRPYPSAASAVRVGGRPSLDSLPALQEVATRARADGCRLVLRYSGTEARLRLYVEAPEGAQAHAWLAALEGAARTELGAG